MVTRVLERSSHILVLAVEHAAIQSYSRTVQPMAMREAGKRLRDGRQWGLIAVDYQDEARDDARPSVKPNDRCETIYTFKPLDN